MPSEVTSGTLLDALKRHVAVKTACPPLYETTPLSIVPLLLPLE